MFQYRPPAGVDDLARRKSRQAFRAGWHGLIHGAFDTNMGRLKAPVDAGLLVDVPIPEPLFFSEVANKATSDPIAVTWEAFPLSIARKYATDPPGAWAAARKTPATTDAYTPKGAAPVTTAYRRQDEYCEWFLYTDASGQPTRLVLTAEGPEYWVALARADFDRVVHSTSATFRARSGRTTFGCDVTSTTTARSSRPEPTTRSMSGTRNVA